MAKYDLGGVTVGDEFISVNAVQPCDLQMNILDLRLDDNSVDEFRIIHTLEHISPIDYVAFMHRLFAMLRPGGTLTIVQTDAGKVIDLYTQGILNFRAMRSTIFTQSAYLRFNVNYQHQNMWNAATLAADLEKVGFIAETFDAGEWSYDQYDDMCPEVTSECLGVMIPNLGVKGTKPCEYLSSVQLEISQPA